MHTLAYILCVCIYMYKTLNIFYCLVNAENIAWFIGVIHISNDPLGKPSMLRLRSFVHTVCGRHSAQHQSICGNQQFFKVTNFKVTKQVFVVEHDLYQILLKYEILLHVSGTSGSLCSLSSVQVGQTLFASPIRTEDSLSRREGAKGI